MTPADLEAAELLRRATAPVIVAVNKADNEKRELEAAEFHALGWEETYPISASHGRGTGDLLDAIVWALPPESEAEVARKQREAEAEAWADEVAAGRLEPFVVGEPEDDLDGDDGRQRTRRRRRRLAGTRHRRRSRYGTGRDRVRRPAERRQVEPAQRAARRGAGDRLRGARDHARRDRYAPRVGAQRGRAHRHGRHPSAGQGRVGSGRRALLDDARADGAVAGRRRSPRHRRGRGADVAGRPRRRATRSRRARASSSRSTSGTSSRTRPTGPSTSTSNGSGTTRRSSSSPRSCRSARRPASASAGCWSWRRHLGRAPQARPDRRAQPDADGCHGSDATAARTRQAAEAVLRDAGGDLAADVRVLRVGRIGGPFLVPALPREPAARDVRVPWHADPARLPRSGVGQAAAAAQDAVGAIEADETLGAADAPLLMTGAARRCMPRTRRSDDGHRAERRGRRRRGVGHDARRHPRASASRSCWSRIARRWPTRSTGTHRNERRLPGIDLPGGARRVGRPSRRSARATDLVIFARPVVASAFAWQAPSARDRGAVGGRAVGRQGPRDRVAAADERGDRRGDGHRLRPGSPRCPAPTSPIEIAQGLPASAVVAAEDLELAARIGRTAGPPRVPALREPRHPRRRAVRRAQERHRDRRRRGGRPRLRRQRQGRADDPRPGRDDPARARRPARIR